MKFENDSVKWILSLNSPLFLCYISNESYNIEIYQTLFTSYFYHKDSIKTISFTHNPESDSFVPPTDSKEKNIQINLGKPIIKFHIKDFNKNNITIPRTKN